eukprot:192657-Rhodomonas_salina.8
MPTFAHLLLMVLLLPLTAANAERLACGAGLPLNEILRAFQLVIPTNDGSIIQQTGTENGASEMLLNIIENNLNSMGIGLHCMEDDICWIEVFDTEKGKIVCAEAFMKAILGNFVNKELEKNDALAYMRID